MTKSFTEEELESLREGGKRLARILETLTRFVAPGVSTKDLNARAEALAREGGDEPAFLGYRPRGADRPFPASICISVNDEVVHGIPNENPKTLREGDIVTLDMGLRHNNLITDAAVTIAVGRIEEEALRLIEATRESLTAALNAARAGNTVGDIGHAVEAVATAHGFSVARELGGHGVGRAVHEEPFVPNFGEQGTGETLVAGMVLAIEPILIEGDGAVTLAADGYTYKTKDGTRAAQFEHTVLVTDGAPKVLTAH